MTQALGAGRALPGRPAGIATARRGAGAALVVVGLPVLTAVLAAADGLTLASCLLLFLLGVVLIGVVGGIAVATAAALASFLLANWFLIPPLHTLRIDDRDNLVALGVFLAVALTSSGLVELAARRRAAAERSRAEALVMARLATNPVASSVESVLDEVAAAFGMTSVALVRRTGGPPVAAVGPAMTSKPTVQVDSGRGLRLVAAGPTPFAEDRRLLRQLAAAAARALDERDLSEEAARGRALAEVDRLRSALLAAVGHDLRTPLASVKAAVTGLRQTDVELPEEHRFELLATIESSTDRLTEMVANLLDLSRLRAGALVVHREVVSVDEVVARVLLAGQDGMAAAAVDNQVRDDLPLLTTDPGLLERVVANLVDNARRHEPPGRAVIVDAESSDEHVRLRVVDHGPGVDPDARGLMFEGFQRLDDRAGTGVGLGLAIVAGFVEALGGTVVPSTTPGGGLTMTVALPRRDGAR
jgi:K+-sensing histidine kinase KdpD